MTKTTRRKFLLTAAVGGALALTAGIVKAEKPVIVEDIQAVPLGAEYRDPVGGAYLLEDNFDGPPLVGVRTWTILEGSVNFWGMPTYEVCNNLLPIEIVFHEPWSSGWD